MTKPDTPSLQQSLNQSGAMRTAASDRLMSYSAEQWKRYCENNHLPAQISLPELEQADNHHDPAGIAAACFVVCGLLALLAMLMQVVE